MPRLPPNCPSVSDRISRSICMGLGYCFIAFAMLTGTPIDGALLGHGSDLHWPSPIVFSAVSLARRCTSGRAANSALGRDDCRLRLHLYRPAFSRKSQTDTVDVDGLGSASLGFPLLHHLMLNHANNTPDSGAIKHTGLDC